MRESAIEAIEEITNADVTTPRELKNQRQNDFDISPKWTQAINEIESEKEISQLLKALANPELNIRRLSVYKLGKIGDPIALAHLWMLHVQDPSWDLAKAIAAIQSRCGFYNYEICQQAQEAENLEFEGNFISNLYKDIDKVISHIQENPKQRQKDTEARLTIDIVNQLRCLGYEASHDSEIGGHVDIVVRGNDFVWLGEAKNYSSNNYLWEGFLQLTTRYSIGDSNQNHGCLLIYIKDEDASSIMESWQNYLFGKSLPNYSFRPCKMRNLAFISTHRHERSGQAFHVRHIPVMLHFAPKDKSGRRRQESP